MAKTKKKKFVKKAPAYDKSKFQAEIKDIDYKNVSVLKRFIGIREQILGRTVTRLSAKKQRKLQKEIKKSRIMGLLPFTDRHSLR